MSTAQTSKRKHDPKKHKKTVKQVKKSEKESLRSNLTLVGLVCIAFALGIIGYQLLLNLVNKSTKEHEPRDAVIENFEKWFKRAGGRALNVQVENFPTMGKGIQATNTIREGDQLLFVPMSAIICRPTILENLRSMIDSSRLQEITADDQLISIFLMQQLSFHNESKWFPYLQILPKRIDRPLFFNEQELDALQDDALAKSIAASKVHLEKTYAELLPIMKQLIPNEEYQSLDLYKWAQSMVSSRALSIKGSRYLAPFADVFNGARHKKKRKYDNGSHFLKYHVVDETGLKIFADRKCSKNHQLFEDYGDNDNHIYLEYHGFVMRNNPFDCIRLHFPEIPESDPAYKAKEKILHTLQIPESPQGCFDRDAVARERIVDFYLQLYAMSESDATKCEKSLPAHRKLHQWDRSACFPDVMDPHRLATRKHVIHQTASEQLKAYPTTIRKDESILEQNSTLSDAERTAIRYRIERKKIVGAILEATKSKMPSEAKAGEKEQPETANPNLKELATNFNEWIEQQKFPINKLRVDIAPNSMRLGTFATSRIQDREVYLSVPDRVLLDEDSALRSPVVGDLIKEVRYSIGKDAFHEVLIHLMHEKFVLKEKSYWYPYLQIIPDVGELDSPAFYSEDELQLLVWTDLYPQILAYRQKLRKSYRLVVQNVMRYHYDVIPASDFTFEKYAWAHAILDSRSIWWNGKRHLVPLLDMINCLEGPDPHRIHQTVLDNTGHNAITRASWEFQAHDQLYENYGQPNNIYLLYHGFVLEKSRNNATLSKKLQLSNNDNPIRKKVQGGICNAVPDKA